MNGDIYHILAEIMQEEIDKEMIETLRRNSLTQEEREMEDVFNRLKKRPVIYPPFTVEKSIINAPPRKLNTGWTLIGINDEQEINKKEGLEKTKKVSPRTGRNKSRT